MVISLTTEELANLDVFASCLQSECVPYISRRILYLGSEAIIRICPRAIAVITKYIWRDGRAILGIMQLMMRKQLLAQNR
jgi:hypothetical protein